MTLARLLFLSTRDCRSTPDPFPGDLCHRGPAMSADVGMPILRDKERPWPGQASVPLVKLLRTHALLGRFTIRLSTGQRSCKGPAVHIPSTREARPGSNGVRDFFESRQVQPATVLSSGGYHRVARISMRHTLLASNGNERYAVCGLAGVGGRSHGRPAVAPRFNTSRRRYAWLSPPGEPWNTAL